MTIAILMPALSPTMTEGKLATWIKQEGDTVSPGDLIAEIETDKATMEVEAVDEGVLGRILIEAGTEGIPINTPIAVLLEDGETVDDIEINAAAPAAAPDQPGALSMPVPETGSSDPVAIDSLAPDESRIFASPLARRMAQQAGIPLTGLAGTGPNGRIIKADVEQAMRGATAAAPVVTTTTATAAPAPVIEPAAAYDAIPTTSMRKVIAQRLTQSKQDAPHFYMTIECEIDELLAVRKQLNEKLESGRISVNDMVIKAAALALKEVPAANSSWTDNEIRQFRSVDISVAVAIDGGLITPVIVGAQNKGIAEIASEMKDLSARARDGKLRPEEYQGGTFSVSNLGMYGIKEFAAVINPPQGAILAVGAGIQSPVVRDGALAIATVMNCTLSCDHRVVDGAVGAAFLAAFRKRVESPLTMLL